MPPRAVGVHRPTQLGTTLVPPPPVKKRAASVLTPRLSASPVPAPTKHTPPSAPAAQPPSPTRGVGMTMGWQMLPLFDCAQCASTSWTLGSWELHLLPGFLFFSSLTCLTDLVLHHGGVSNAGIWSWDCFLLPSVACRLMLPTIPLLVLPLPDLTPGSPVTAYSLLEGRLVRTFAHAIALLPCVGYCLSCLVFVLSGFLC